MMGHTFRLLTTGSNAFFKKQTTTSKGKSYKTSPFEAQIQQQWQKNETRQSVTAAGPFQISTGFPLTRRRIATSHQHAAAVYRSP